MTSSAQAMKLFTAKIRAFSLNRVDVKGKTKSCPRINGMERGKLAEESDVHLDIQTQSVFRIDVNDILMQVDKKNIAHLAEVESILLRWKEEVICELLSLLGKHGLSNPSSLVGSDVPGCSKFVPHGITNLDATCSIPKNA